MEKKIYLIISLCLLLVISVKSQSVTYCNLGDTVRINLTDSRGSIQWQESDDSLNWVDITGATSVILDYFPRLGSQWVRAELLETDCPKFITEETKIIASCPSATDFNGNVYQSVQIGNQCWTKSNLKATRFSDGSLIPNITSDIEWISLTSPGWCNYDNNEWYGLTNGKLYNWYAVADPRNLCPVGWHVPTDAEWTILTDFLGGSSVAGGKMKTTYSWNAPNTGATNESGFSGLPGGLRYYNDVDFYLIGNYGYWWSSSESSPTVAWYRSLYYGNGTAYRSNDYKQNGFSVRCLRD